MLIESSPPSVLVTGCSSGIGRASALDLAARGWNVFASVRQVVDGEELKQSFSSLSSPRGSLQTVQLDITNQCSIDRAITELRNILDEHGLDALVNNAGILVPGPLELISAAQLHHQFAVNVFGTHAITQAALPLLRAASSKRAARVVFVGSISGRVTPPFYGAYASSKHALVAMTDAWRMELARWNIWVSIVEPDSVATPIWGKSSAVFSDMTGSNATSSTVAYEGQLRTTRRSGLANSKSGMQPEKVVAAIRRALSSRRPRARYPVGWRTRVAFWAKPILPSFLMDWSLRKAIGG